MEVINVIIETLKQIRSHRSFCREKISMEALEKMIESTRYASSTKNSQKIRYALINDEEICKQIFSFVKFAGAISWNPTLEEAPTAYILMCSETPLTGITEKYLYFDMGIASHNILLIANELGYGGCIMGAYNRAKVDRLVQLPDGYSSHILLALGKPTDKIHIVDAIDNVTTYYRDENNQHFVPKLSLENISLLKK